MIPEIVKCEYSCLIGAVIKSFSLTEQVLLLNWTSFFVKLNKYFSLTEEISECETSCAQSACVNILLENISKKCSMLKTFSIKKSSQ